MDILSPLLCVVYVAASATSRSLVQRSPTGCVCVCVCVCEEASAKTVVTSLCFSMNSSFTTSLVVVKLQFIKSKKFRTY